MNPNLEIVLLCFSYDSIECHLSHFWHADPLFFLSRRIVAKTGLALAIQKKLDPADFEPIVSEARVYPVLQKVLIEDGSGIPIASNVENELASKTDGQIAFSQ